MALTKIGTDGVKDDAVTSDKVANSINTAIAANTAKTQTTINNNADNRVITGSDTANTLEGEANLSFDGTKLGIGTTSPISTLHLHEAGASGSPIIQFSNGDTGATSGDGFAIGVADNESPFIYNRENTDLRFATNNTERMRILSGGGLTFNGDTAAANALDDYEEGTFTPSIYYQNSSGITISTNSAGGKYTKIGRVVWIIGAINWTVSGSPINDNVAILGLPFATNTGQVGVNDTRFAGANIILSNTSDQSNVYMATPYGNNGINLAVQQDQGNRSNELGGNSGMIAGFQLWYHTA